jgi:hypothetical protein
MWEGRTKKWSKKTKNKKQFPVPTKALGEEVTFPEC